jgi:uncharacterized protein YjbI with pentapeptide repeats
MGFRQPWSGHAIRRPSIDEDNLTPAPARLRGKFAIRLERVHGDQTGVRGEGSIIQSVADRLTAVNSHLSLLELIDVAFQGADLSNSVWDDVSARRVEFSGCRMAGTQILFDSTEDVAFIGCRLDYCALATRRVDGTVFFQNCTLSDASLAGRLDGFIFRDCNLSGMQFDALSAAGCDLRDSLISGAKGFVTLRGARISADQLTSAAAAIASDVGLEVTN